MATWVLKGLTNILTRLDLPKGTQTVQSYDALQRLTQVINKKTGGADLNKFAYAYDNRDVRTGVQQKYGADPLRQVDYTYDAVDQLVGEAATGGVTATNYSNAYSYDAMGNRLKRENTQGTTTAMTRSGVNELNQLTSVSTSVDGGPRVTGGMSYDAAGNLTETTGVGGTRTLYVYDDADRLFRIEKRDANDTPLSKSEFVYDYASRKAVSQEFTFTAGAWVQSSEKRRVFNGLDVIQERDELNLVTAQLVRGGNIGGILSRSTAVGASFFSYDGSGNVTLLSDTNGNEVGRYRYDAFGNTLEISGVRAAENPYRFSTKELHGTSGLYDFGYRFYSASLGRWINRDPIGENGGINLYAMVDNNPVNSWDSYGLSGERPELPPVSIASENGWSIRQYHPSADAHGNHLHLQHLGRGIKISIDQNGNTFNDTNLQKWNSLKATERKVLRKFMTKNKAAMCDAVNKINVYLKWKKTTKFSITSGLGKVAKGLNSFVLGLSVLDFILHPERYDPYTLYWDPSSKHWYYGNGVPYMLPMPAPKFARKDEKDEDVTFIEDAVKAPERSLFVRNIIAGTSGFMPK